MNNPPGNREITFNDLTIGDVLNIVDWVKPKLIIFSSVKLKDVKEFIDLIITSVKKCQK